MKPKKAASKQPKAEWVVQDEIFWCLLINKMVQDLCMSVVNGATLFHAEAEKTAPKKRHQSVVNGATLFHAEAKKKWHQKSGIKVEQVVRVEIFWCPLINKMVPDMHRMVPHYSMLKPKKRHQKSGIKAAQSRTGCAG